MFLNERAYQIGEKGANWEKWVLHIRIKSHIIMPRNNQFRKLADQDIEA